MGEIEATALMVGGVKNVNNPLKFNALVCLDWCSAGQYQTDYVLLERVRADVRRY